jgi:hypothetical protein
LPQTEVTEILNRPSKVRVGRFFGALRVEWQLITSSVQAFQQLPIRIPSARRDNIRDIQISPNPHPLVPIGVACGFFCFPLDGNGAVRLEPAKTGRSTHWLDWLFSLSFSDGSTCSGGLRLVFGQDEAGEPRISLQATEQFMVLRDFF